MSNAAAVVALQPRVAKVCDGCPLQDRCFLAGSLSDEAGEHAGVVLRRRKVAVGDKLYRRNAPFTSLFQICKGALKTQRETPNGGLVVTGFFLPCDIVGVEALADRTYPTDAVATMDTEVCQLDFEHLLTHCARHSDLHGWIIARIADHVRRKDCDLSWSGGLNAHDRILRFFLELYDRPCQDKGAWSSERSLPMKKQDIARYLRMTPETLSRNLLQLRHSGLLQLKHDCFVLPDVERARAVTQL